MSGKTGKDKGPSVEYQGVVHGAVRGCHGAPFCKGLKIIVGVNSPVSLASLGLSQSTICSKPQQICQAKCLLGPSSFVDLGCSGHSLEAQVPHNFGIVFPRSAPSDPRISSRQHKHHQHNLVDALAGSPSGNAFSWTLQATCGQLQLTAKPTDYNCSSCDRALTLCSNAGVSCSVGKEVKAR
eukprot:scaffold244132_cov18-Tisochrysis_lutea.AAC.2